MLQVLIADCDPVYVELLTELIHQAEYGSEGVNVASSAYGEDIRRLAREQPWDVFIIGLNNVIFDEGDANVGRIMRLAIELRETFQTPTLVIAPMSVLLLHEATLDRVDGFLPKPCEWPAIQEAIGKCVGKCLR